MIDRTKETVEKSFFNEANINKFVALIAVAAITGCSGASDSGAKTSAQPDSENSTVDIATTDETIKSQEETDTNTTKSDDTQSVKVKKVSPVGDNNAYLNMSRSKKKLVGSSKKDKLNANYHFNKANQLREGKQYDEAILEYKRAIRSYPGDGAFYKNLGGTFAMVGKLSDAELVLTRGCEVSPKDWLMWNNLAVVLQNLDKKTECKEAIKKSLSLKPPAHAVENMQLTLKQLDGATN